MLRIIFRTVLVLTLTCFAIFRASKTAIPPSYVMAFSYWLLLSAVLAFVFLVYSLVKAVNNPVNRRLHIRDIMLSLVWLIFWVLNIGRH